MKWFKHDTDANMDAKLQEVLLDYGLEGYGLYWYCIELIAGKVDAENLTFSLEHDSRIIARNTGSTPQKVTEMMTRFVDLGLFQDNGGLITCLRLAKRLDKSMTSNPEMRLAIDNMRKNHDSIRTQSGKVMQDKNRLEEKRVDKNRKDNINTPSDFSDVLDHLNLVTGRQFKTGNEITARLKDYTVNCLKLVIDYKTREWKGTDMEKYLRPQTLFGKSKFEGYLNDARSNLPTGKQSNTYQTYNNLLNANLPDLGEGYGQPNSIQTSNGGTVIGLPESNDTGNDSNLLGGTWEPQS